MREIHGTWFQERFLAFPNQNTASYLIQAWCCDMCIQKKCSAFCSSYFWPFLVFVHFSSVFTETRTAGDFRGATPLLLTLNYSSALAQYYHEDDSPL